MFDHAGLFVCKVLPWPVPGEASFVNIHWKTSKLDQHGKPVWYGRAFTDYQNFMSTLAWVSTLTDTRDLYICMSSQAQAQVMTTKTGRTWLRGVRSSHNALKMRSFFIDVDVKEEPKGYPDTNTALAALQQFMATLRLPMPTATVASGSGGFHVHWALAEPITVAQWQPLANALARATDALGLRCDRGCTIDSARILRLPDTKNFKSDPPNPVTLMSIGEHVTLEVMTAALGPYMGAPVTPQQDPAMPWATPVTPQGNDELGAGITTVAPPIYIEEVAKHCAFVNEAIQTGGAAFDNQQWFTTTSIATFVEDGRTQAHRMALGHATYDTGETDKLYTRLDEGRSKNTQIGWPRCEKIALSYKGCQTCPLRPDNKSPLNYGYASAQAKAMMEAAAATPGVSTLPHGYFQTPEGIVFFQHVDDEGQQTNIPVLPYPVSGAWLQDNPWILHFTTKIGKRTFKIEAPLLELSPKDGISKVFGGQGIMLKEKAKPIAKEFFVSWIQKLQQSRDSVVSSTPFGWSDVNGKIEGFTYAGRVWGANIDRPAAMPDPVLNIQYSPKGELGPWLEASKVITEQGRPELDAILAGSFGAPLMRFTGHDGAMLNAYSEESGIGKTTAMRIALAVWADPVKAMQGLSDTANSVIGKMGVLKVLPLFWDELKTENDIKKFVSMIFTVTGGVEKSRMRADTTLRDRGTWQTLVITACNDSLMDTMQRATPGTNAGIYRLFEYSVAPGQQNTMTHGEVSRRVERLKTNYGNAGLLYAQFIGANHERVAKEVAAMQDRLSAAVHAGNDERFWIATMAVSLMGALYANELRLTNFNVQNLSRFLLTVLEGMRGEIKDSPVDMKNQMSVSTVLSQFLKAMQARHTLLTNKIHTGAGKPAANSILVKNDPSKLDGIYVQIGLEDKKMRISSTFFTNWMNEHDYSRHAFTRALKDEFGMRKINGKLGSGTAMASPMEYLLEIDLNDPRLAGFIET